MPTRQNFQKPLFKMTTQTIKYPGKNKTETRVRP